MSSAINVTKHQRTSHLASATVSSSATMMEMLKGICIRSQSARSPGSRLAARCCFSSSTLTFNLSKRDPPFA